MNNWHLILLAVAPSVALIAFILLNDRYDREPFWQLVKVFFFGMLSTVPILIVELLLSKYNVFSGLLGAAVQAFVIVGFTEEFFKRLVVQKTVLFKPFFNEKLDGIVYCCMASLGFATVENVMYVLQYSAIDPDIWLMRAIVSVPTHMLLGIIMGYYMGLSRFGPNRGKTLVYFRRALVVPALLHGAFDFILMSGFKYYIFVFVPLVLTLWVMGMVMLRRFVKSSKIEHSYLHHDRDLHGWDDDVV